MKPLRIGTRGSALARSQTGWVAARLMAAGSEIVVETITTRGDTRGDAAVATLGADGVFVRELEQALLTGRIDVAVHSLKDLPTAEVPGLELGCVPVRATPFDALVARTSLDLDGLPAAAVVGTASVRRAAQLKLVRPDLVVRAVRGNVDTRLRRLDAGDYDALVLATAGLERLGLANRITAVLTPPEFWPAIGQGALGLQIRAGDTETRAAITPLDDPASRAAVAAERECLAALAGGCLAPVAGWARVEEHGRLRLGARILDDTGETVRHVTADQVAAADESPASLGRRVAAALVEAGGEALLERMRGSLPPP